MNSVNPVDLSILIVNWNSARYLPPCLSTIYQHTDGLRVEVVIVDNASYDGSADLVASQFPQAIYVQSHENLGFARANNLAFRHSSGGTILLLNPDTEMTDDAALMMWKYLKEHHDVGAVGCRLLNTDLTLQRTYTQAFPTIVNQVFGLDLFHRLMPRARLWGLRPMIDYLDQPMDAEVLSGSCIMLRRRVFEEVNGFSSKYYMYGDDVDLCYRIRRAGYKIHYIGSRSIIHHGGTSSAFRRENEFVTVMQKEAIFTFLKDTRGTLYASTYRAAIGTAAVVRLLLILLISPALAVWLGNQRLTAALRKWWSVLRWAAGREGWAARAGQ